MIFLILKYYVLHPAYQCTITIFGHLDKTNLSLLHHIFNMLALYISNIFLPLPYMFSALCLMHFSLQLISLWTIVNALLHTYVWGDDYERRSCGPRALSLEMGFTFLKCYVGEGHLSRRLHCLKCKLSPLSTM